MTNSLVCPETKQSLRETSYVDAEVVIASGQQLMRRATGSQRAPAKDDRVLVRADDRGAYPIVKGIPVLLRPEMLTTPGLNHAIDTSRDPYREAYEEMAFYDEVADNLGQQLGDSAVYEMVRRVQGKSDFPKPAAAWMDATYDCAAQWDAYSHLAPIAGGRLLQLGGKGIHAVKFLMAGAAESWLLTPMVGEAQFAQQLAAQFGVADRLHCVVGLGEEMPFERDSFSGIFCGGCLHHTVTSLSIPEIERVLCEGGRFAAVEPWKAPLYGIGTKLIGKREVGVNCRPIDESRASPLFEHFRDSSVQHHGAMSRYPLIALSKFGLKLRLGTVQRITEVDDAISNLVPFVRRQGSSVALLATKPGATQPLAA